MNTETETPVAQELTPEILEMMHKREVARAERLVEGMKKYLGEPGANPQLQSIMNHGAQINALWHVLHSVSILTYEQKQDVLDQAVTDLIERLEQKMGRIVLARAN